MTKLLQSSCPRCRSEVLEVHRRYETLHQGEPDPVWVWGDCGQVFSETKGSFLEGLTKPLSLVVQVLTGRSEGLGANAACRVFGIAKNALLRWERKFAEVRETLMVYALLHTFLSQVIEGDEPYTKVGNVVTTPMNRCIPARCATIRRWGSTYRPD